MTSRPWLLVGLLWVVALLNYLDRQVVFSLFPLLKKELGATDVQLGLTSTVFLWVYGGLSPFTGYLADRFGRVRVILISLAVWSTVTLLTGFARNMNELLIARALMGISEACYLPAALALIVEAHPASSRSLATGVHQSGLYTGIILGGAWGGWMGERYGWRPVFLILGIIGVVYVAVLASRLRVGPKSSVLNVGTAPVGFLNSLRSLLRLPGFTLLTLAFMAFSIQSWIIYTWLPIYLYERFGLTLAQAGFASTFYIQVASFGGILFGGWLADRWSRAYQRGRLLTQIAGLAGAAPFIFLIGYTNSFAMLIVALVIYGLGRGLYDANTMPVMSQIVKPEMRATGYGIFNLVGCVVGGVAAAAAGSLKAVVGLSIAFQCSAAILFIGALLLWFVPVGMAPVIGAREDVPVRAQ